MEDVMGTSVIERREQHVHCAGVLARYHTLRFVPKALVDMFYIL